MHHWLRETARSEDRSPTVFTGFEERAGRCRCVAVICHGEYRCQKPAETIGFDSAAKNPCGTAQNIKNIEDTRHIGITQAEIRVGSGQLTL